MTRHPPSVVTRCVRGLGQLMLTVGYVVLLLAVYEVWVSELLSDRRQDSVAEALREEWDVPPALPVPAAAPVVVPPVVAPAAGEAFAFLHIPRLGADWSRAVIEGTDPVDLNQGPGHYTGTAMPGELGNVALAGHRVGRGSSFLYIDELRPGDPIIVETPAAWYVYRVLGDPASGSFTGDPSGIPGQQIVRPDDIQVVAPTPNGPVGGPPTGAYLTLTTCHPEYSARERLIVHAALDGAAIPRAAMPDGPRALHEG